MLDGITIFAGDSITVGLAPFVSVNGEKITVAKGGISSSAILEKLRNEEMQGTLDRAVNLVVLGGTNDIGGGLTPEAIFGNLRSIWAMGKVHGLHVYAMTIPPAKGYSGWNGRDVAVDAKRRAVNALIHASVLPDRVIDLDTMMGSPEDSGRMLPSFDSGDHIHPRKDKMGSALTTELSIPLTLLPGGNIAAVPFDKRKAIGVAAGTIGFGALCWGVFEFLKGRK